MIKPKHCIKFRLKANLADNAIGHCRMNYIIFMSTRLYGSLARGIRNNLATNEKELFKVYFWMLKVIKTVAF